MMARTIRFCDNLNKKDGYRQLNVRQQGSLRPWDHRDKCYMDRKRIQCLSNASQHIPIYFQPFLRYSGISVATGEWLIFNSTRERMSVFNHILLSPGYAPRTIAVNVTWIEREFNACQKHRSMYSSIFNRLRAIARYWSDIATFSYPLAFNAHVRSGPWDNRGKCYMDRQTDG